MLQKSFQIYLLQSKGNMRYLLCVMILAVAVSAASKEKFKYVDRNGLIFWLDDESKIPPPIPINYKYVDDTGLAFWVDDINKIPVKYRDQNKPKNTDAVEQKPVPTQKPEEKKYSTKISIVNNQIFVPVLFRNKGHRIKAKMILDTGASMTTIYPALATKLNLGKNKISRARSMIADGTTTDGLLTKVDHIEVDEMILANPEVMVMMQHSDIGADGLLGNSFLHFFNFTIDYKNQLLIWN